MDRDEVIALARKAGFVVDEESQKHQPNCIFHTWHLIDEGLIRFAALVAAQEREMCAKACDEEAKRAYQNDGLDDGYEAGKSVAAKNCAAAIRARSNNGN